MQRALAAVNNKNDIWIVVYICVECRWQNLPTHDANSEGKRKQKKEKRNIIFFAILGFLVSTDTRA